MTSAHRRDNGLSRPVRDGAGKPRSHAADRGQGNPGIETWGDVAVGIAFGVNKQKQDIGDVLVSKQLRLYDLQRVGQWIVLRDDKPHAATPTINDFVQFDQVACQVPR